MTLKLRGIFRNEVDGSLVIMTSISTSKTGCGEYETVVSVQGGTQIFTGMTKFTQGPAVNLRIKVSSKSPMFSTEFGEIVRTPSKNEKGSARVVTPSIDTKMDSGPQKPTEAVVPGTELIKFRS